MISGLQLVLWIFFLPISAWQENIFEVKHSDNEEKTQVKDKNFAQCWLFHRQTSYRQASCRQILHWKNIFADRYTDRFFASMTSISHAVLDLDLKCFYFWKVYVLWERIQVSLQRKGCPSFFSSGVAYQFVNILENMS